MSLRTLAFALSACALAASAAFAQQTNPLDAVPDKMPFDIPYGAPITLEHAQAAINAAVAESKKRGWKMNVAVMDSGANLVAFQRMDGAQLASIAIAEHKARFAVKARRESRLVEDLVQQKNFIYLLSLDDFIASRGGIPLVSNGQIVGAIGCSGGTGSQDEVVCKVGAATVK